MKKLHQILAGCTAQQLEQVARLWGIRKEQLDGIGTTNNSLQATAWGGLDAIAARFVWEHLPEDERKVLYNILHLSSSHHIVSDVLLKLTRLPLPRYEAAVETLQQHMLLLEEETKTKTTTKQKLEMPSASAGKQTTISGMALLYVPQEIIESLDLTGREIFVPGYDRSKMSLEKVLSSVSQQRIYEIGLLYGIALNDYYFASNPRTRLVGNLVQPDVVAYAVEQFDPATRKLCQWLCDSDGKASMTAVRKFTGCDDAGLSTLLHTLERYAMAFDTFSGPERVLFVPHELLKSMKKALAQSAANVTVDMPTELVALDEAPQRIHSGDSIMLYDLAAIIGSVYQQDIEPTQAGKVPKRIANKILPLLHGEPRVVYEGEDNYLLEMLFGIAQELQLLSISKSSFSEIKPHYEPGSRLKLWSQMDAREQTRHLLNNWLSSQHWIDIAGADFVENYAYYLTYQAARNAVVSHLHNCKPGQWYSMESLLGTIKAENPFILRSQMYNAGFAHFRNRREILANWRKCDGEVLIGMLSSSLYELGIVAVGYTDEKMLDTEEPVNPDAFMVTDFGARVLLAEAKAALKKEGGLDLGEIRSSTAEFGAHRTLVVQPNFELLLLQPDVPTLYSVLPFAVVNQVGMVSRLTLTRPALLRSLRSGLTIDQILQTLEEHSQKEIAQNVSYTLRDWARLYKEVKISQVLLLEVATEAQADEMCASSKLQHELDLRRIGPRAIAVGSDVTLQRLRSALDKEGIVANISGDIITRRDTMFNFGRLR
jgi:hypothetical protein